MPKKNRTQQVYKTESQLKEEAIVKHAAEAEALATENKSELQKKRENFWYHYKWHTIAAIFAAVLLTFFIKDTVFRTKPDVTIVIVSGGYLGEYELSLLTDALEGYATDFNDDKKISVSTDFISLPPTEDEAGQNESPTPDLTGGQQDMASMMKLMAVIAAGSDPIYLLDESAYDYISGMGKNEEGYVADNAFEAFSVPAEKLGGEAVAIRGMRFYLRSSCNDEAYYEYCKQLLENIDRS